MASLLWEDGRLVGGRNHELAVGRAAASPQGGSPSRDFKILTMSQKQIDCLDSRRCKKKKKVAIQ